jgi:2-oxoglutarate ferredoxin oxidoreductase subunit alpha
MAFDLTIKFAGEGGEGVISAGDFTMRAATYLGLEVVTFKSFPAEIKGGYALSQVRMSDEKILSQGDGFQILFAFNGEAYEVNKPLLKPGTVLVWDGPEGGDFEPEFDWLEKQGVITYAVPMSKLAKEEVGAYITKNMVALGAASELFNIPIDVYKEQIVSKFSKKGQDVVELNFKALDAGINWVKNNIKKVDPYRLPERMPRKDVIILEGNEAIALGAAVAGCKVFAAYPITPATTVGNYLSEIILKANGYVYQAEDEISSMAIVIGASFSGVKAMTATSGPGISLMQELIGLASMAEIPAVIVDVQRGGPSTGMPTKHDQADLYAAAIGGHGDGQRIVIAPTNVEENFYLTIEAFNLAERYQCPVLFLTDASLSLRAEAIPTPNIKEIQSKLINRPLITKDMNVDPNEILRYKVTETGIAPMLAPGVSPKPYAATGLEHGEDSSPRTRPDVRVKMMEKRFRKLQNIEDENQHLIEWDLGDLQEGDKADISVIAWGLTASITKEAVQRLRKKGYKVAALYPKLLYPVPAKAIEKVASMSDITLVPEANYTGQFARFIRMYTNVKPVQFNIYRGEPFIPAEIEAKIEELVGNKVNA